MSHGMRQKRLPVNVYRMWLLCVLVSLDYHVTDSHTILVVSKQINTFVNFVRFLLNR